jgi:exodeoxyribonuclease VII large subunit
MPAATVNPADVLTVSALTQQIQAALEGEFLSVWVSGEVSNLKRHGSGHTYFSLKDDGAVLGAVIWRSVGIRFRFEPRDGMQVIARGRISVYAPHGKYQLNVEEIHPKGVGALELALQQLRERLQAKGYFDPRRKTPLPAFVRSLAIVTSPSGAAIRDMLELLTRRWPVAAILVVPVRVQGEGAATEIAAAVRCLNRLHQAGALSLDAVIVGRGGGSLEDLWAFNDAAVADAIFESRIPVVSAVGHETDVTISDLVADHRALTPSHAITDLTPDRMALLAGLDDRRDQLRKGLVGRLVFARQRLAALTDRRAFRNPLDRIRDRERLLDDIDGRTSRAARAGLERARARLAAIAGQLESLSPLNVLARGYSLTRSPTGHVIRDARNVQVGDELVTRLAAGELVSRVIEVKPELRDVP